MDRRGYLTALGTVNGCSEAGSTATPTRPESRTSAEATPTPAPRITDADLLLEQASFATLGDLESVGRGAILFFGIECRLPVDGTAASGHVPAGAEVLVDLRDNQLNYPGSYTYRLEEVDADVTFSIDPPA